MKSRTFWTIFRAFFARTFVTKNHFFGANFVLRECVSKQKCAKPPNLLGAGQMGSYAHGVGRTEPNFNRTLPFRPCLQIAGKSGDASGSGPNCRLEGIPPHASPRPPPSWSIEERARGGGEGGSGWGGKGWGLREGSSNCNGGGKDPPKGSSGQTHIP